MQSQFKCLGDIQDLVLGDNCSITREPWPFFDLKGGGLVLGDNVVISSGVYIMTHDHQFENKNWRDLEEIAPGKPTELDDNVFVGVNAIIMPTCKHIGKNSVVGAGAVVTKNIPDNEIWAGNPAKKIKSVGGEDG